MKKLIGIVFGLLLVGVMRPSVANVADVDWLGRISLLGGAESEERHRKDEIGGAAHGFGMLEGLGVIPFTPQFGIQLSGAYQYGGGWGGHKIGFQGGPIFGFGMGKVGVFVTDQFRVYNPSATGSGIRSVNLFWITPAVAFYDLIPNTNLDVWFSQQISKHTTTLGPNGDATKSFAPTSTLRAALNWFPGGMPFGKDNTELTVGVQANGISGMDKTHAGSGVGPVLGMAVLPWQNLELQVFKATIDNRNRYRVTSGVQYFFDRGNSSLMQLRRKYLEPTNMPNMANTFYRY
jgi:hypothetical protein